MGFSTSTCTEFVEVLASKAPVPGGGGASALVGAVGTALGNMVGSLTVGKKKYADVEDEMWELKKKCDQLQKILILIESRRQKYLSLFPSLTECQERQRKKKQRSPRYGGCSEEACSVRWRSWRNAVRPLNLSLSSDQKVPSLQSVMPV